MRQRPLSGSRSDFLNACALLVLEVLSSFRLSWLVAYARRTLIVIGLALAYFCAALVGFRHAIVAEQVTLVWPPSGIALAAVLLLGRWVWPGILLGDFVANL